MNAEKEKEKKHLWKRPQVRTISDITNENGKVSLFFFWLLVYIACGPIASWDFAIVLAIRNQFSMQ